MSNNKDFIVKNAVEVGKDTKVTLGTITSSNIDLSTGNYFSDTLAANTTYTISNAGDVQSFQLEVTGGIVGYDIGSANYDSKSFSVASQETNPYGIAFKSDGTKMYISGSTGDDINQYSLSTAWDVSTASFDSVTFSVISQATSLTGLVFSADGTKFYVPCGATDAVYQYTMSTAWDLSTASYDSKSLDVSAQGSGPAGLYFKSDGLTLFILDYIPDTVFEYTLSTAWDISTASYSSNSVSVASTGEALSIGLWFSDDGTKFIVAGDTNDKAYEFTMTTAWDITTASYSGTSFNLASAGSTTFPTGITFKTDGTKMYSVMRGSDTVYQYSTTSVVTLTWPSSIEWAGGVAPAAPANGETDVFTISTDDSGTTYHGFKTADNLS
jgi:hypothetical protein